MRYKLLGKSGLRVSELCLGTMTFGEEWGWGASKDESRQIFDTFVEAGGNFLDTANGYTDGSSEKIVGEFIASEHLSPEHLQRLNGVSQIELGFPHDFLQSDTIRVSEAYRRYRLYGGTFNAIENHHSYGLT